MFKIVFFWIGRIMLAGAYGWKKSSESFPAIIGATMYFVFWMLCLVFSFIESEDKLFSIIIAIVLPVIYGLFVLIVRLKEHKRHELDTTDLEKSTLSKKESLQNTNKKEDYSNKENPDKETLFSVIKDYINRKKENKITQKTEDAKKSNILFIIFAVVSVLFFITSCVFFYHLQTNINDLNAEISDLNTEISDLKKDKSELMNTINELNSTVSSQSEEISHWKNKWREVWIEHLFCER